METPPRVTFKEGIGGYELRGLIIALRETGGI
jgi:hypothetical protein